MLLLNDRKEYDESRPLILSSLDRDLSVVVEDHLPGYCKAEAIAAVALGREERLEYLVLHFRRHAHAGVAYLYAHRIAVFYDCMGRTERKLAALRHRFCCIDDYVA